MVSGQDSERGTFSHRHAAWYDSKDRTRYVPLLEMEDRKGKKILRIQFPSI